MSRIQMCQTMLIVLPPVAVAVFLLSINQLDSAKIQNHLFRSYYTNICDEKRIINSGITIFDISDHLPIFVYFNFTIQPIKILNLNLDA